MREKLSNRTRGYPTRRSDTYPDGVYDAVQANATTAEVLSQGKGGVVQATIRFFTGHVEALLARLHMALDRLSFTL